MGNTNLKPVCNINLDAYTGLWYQFSTNLLTSIQATGPFSYSVTAEYQKIDDKGTISVKNRALNTNYKVQGIDGISYPTSPDCPGARKVSFPGVPFDGDYIIVKLGPIVRGKYEYAIVLGPFPIIGYNIDSSINPNGCGLYVLVRNPNNFAKKYFCEVNDYLRENGFNKFFNKQLLTANALPKPVCNKN